MALGIARRAILLEAHENGHSRLEASELVGFPAGVLDGLLELLPAREHDAQVEVARRLARGRRVRRVVERLAVAAHGHGPQDPEDAPLRGADHLRPEPRMHCGREE